MAVIMRMRRHAGVIIAAVIALAILSFLLQDALNSNAGIFGGGGSDHAGKINGRRVSGQDFSRHFEEIQRKYEIYSGRWNVDQPWTEAELQQLSDIAWNDFIEAELMTEEYEALGLIVTDEEMSEAIYGNQQKRMSPAQEIQSLYSQFLDFEQSGGFDVQRLADFLSGRGNRNPNDPSWQAIQAADQYFEYALEDIRKRILQQKYNELFRQSIYVPDWQAKQANERQNQKSNIRYVMLPYASLPDSLIKPTDAQLEEYLRKHGKEYEREASRDLRFVMFEAFPTPEDTAAILSDMSKLIESFRTTADDSSFVEAYSEVEVNSIPFNPSFFFRDDLDLVIADSLFKVDTGTIIGPYQQDDRFHATKLLDRQRIPDSLKLTEIVLFFRSPEPKAKDTTARKLDSLIQLYRTGMPFDSLARKTENMQFSNRLGDMGWIKPDDARLFPNIKDSLFLGGFKAGDTVRLRSRAGVYFYRITAVADSQHVAVKYADLQKRIDPSEKTVQAENAKARKFKGKLADMTTFDTVAVSQGLTVRPAANITPATVNIPLIDVPAREIVRWAFKDAKVGDIQMFELEGRKFVVVGVEAAREKGVPPLEDVREEVTSAVIRELKKEQLTDDAETALAGSTTIEDVAGKLGLEIAEADGVSYEGRMIQGLGAEPAVVAAAQGLREMTLSTPVQGNNGVFVLVVTARTPAPEVQDLTNLKNGIAQGLMGKLGYGIYEAMKSDADIEDQRYLHW